MLYKYAILLLCFHFWGCKKDINSFPNYHPTNNATTIIAHKAGGGSNNPNKENTVEAAKYGLSYLDGLEVDIQKSRDGTIWLYHDETIFNESGDLKRIPGLKDEEIRNIIKANNCPLNTLEELLIEMQKANCKGWLSLDIKPWLPTRFSNTQGYLIELADEICRLSKKYNCSHHIMAECENAVCLKRIKELDTEIVCYLTTYGDFEKGTYRALKSNFNGISFKYENKNISKEQIELLHSKGLKIQLWTINDIVDIKDAQLLLPDFIQTDNVKLE